MRFAIALLVVINGLLLAVLQGILAPPQGAPSDPAPQPLRADKIVVRAVQWPEETIAPVLSTATSPPTGQTTTAPNDTVGTSATAQETAAALSSADAPSPEPEAAVAATAAASPQPVSSHGEPPSPPPTQPVQDKVAAKPAPANAATPPSVAPPSPSGERTDTKTVIACRQLTTSNAEFATIAMALARSLEGLKLNRQEHSEVIAWWVTTPKFANAQEAARAAEELRAKGVKDLFAVRDPGPHQWRISLGVLRTRERAEVLARELRTKGVQNIEILPRDSRTEITMTVRGATERVLLWEHRVQARLPAVRLENCAP